MVVTTPSRRFLILWRVWANLCQYSGSSGGQSPVSPTTAKHPPRGVMLLPQPLPLLASITPFQELYWPSSMLRFGAASDSHGGVLEFSFVGLINLSRTSLSRFGRGEGC